MSAYLLFIALIVLGGMLTGLSGWKRYLPFSMAASLVWLALGVLLLTSPDTIGLDTVLHSWVTILGFVFLLMTIVPILLWTMTETTKTHKGIQWKEYVRGSVIEKEPKSVKAQREYREKLRNIRQRRGR